MIIYILVAAMSAFMLFSATVVCRAVGVFDRSEESLFGVIQLLLGMAIYAILWLFPTCMGLGFAVLFDKLT